jgi:flagellar biosynthesis/type III secretory pathway protein FliH
VKDKFNIMLNDDVLKRLEKMENIVRDKYEQGLREGEAKGRAEGLAEAMDLMADSIVSVVRDGGLSVEKALSLFRIPEKNKAEVESTVMKRLGQPS